MVNTLDAEVLAEIISRSLKLSQTLSIFSSLSLGYLFHHDKRFLLLNLQTIINAINGKLHRNYRSRTREIWSFWHLPCIYTKYQDITQALSDKAHIIQAWSDKAHITQAWFDKAHINQAWSDKVHITSLIWPGPHHSSLIWQGPHQSSLIWQGPHHSSFI